MVRRANKHRRPCDYTAGMKVWLSTANLPATLVAKHKLAAPFIGPYVIESMVNRVAAKLQLPTNFAIHPVFHVAELKPHVTSRHE